MMSFSKKKLLNLSIYGAIFALLKQKFRKAALEWQPSGHLS